MYKRYSVACCASYLFVLVFLLPPALRSEVPAGISVVAKVGDEKITLDDLRRVEQRLRRFISSQDKREFLQPFIDREILRIEAERMGLADAPEVVKTLDTIRRRQLAEKVYSKEVTEKISVSEQEIRQYFVEYGLDQKHEVRASHIQFRTFEETQAVLERLAIGDDFAELAAETSIDSATASEGGDVGYWQLEDARKSNFVQHFIDMEVGEISSPYRNARGGYHLIKVTEHRLLGFDRQEFQIKRIVERKKKKERWTAYLAEKQERFKLVTDDATLALLLDEGRFAENRMPEVASEHHSQILLRFDGGEVNLVDYMAMVKRSTIKERARAVDSTEVVRFALREAMQTVVLPLIAEQKGWHLDGDVTAYLREKKDQAMVEMLRRVAVEEPILTEQVKRTYYQDHQPDFLVSDRVFFEGGLLESAEKADRVMARVRDGEKLATVMKEYPAFSDQWRRYDVFSFSPSGTLSHGERWAKAVDTVRDLTPGEVAGPVVLDFEGSSKGYLVVQSLATHPAQVLPYDDPLVQGEVWRKTKYENRDEINRSFFAYLGKLRQEYEPTVVVYDDVLSKFGEDIH